MYNEEYKLFMCVQGDAKISRNVYQLIKEVKLCKSDVAEASLIRARLVSRIISYLMNELLLREVDIPLKNVPSVCRASRPRQPN